MRKKKQEEKKVDNNYKDFNEELGFLYLILNRKKELTKQFLLKPYAIQKQDNDPINDDEIEGIIVNIVQDTISTLGNNYIAFLCDKYFGNKENIIKFITEDIYADLISTSISENNSKIKSRLLKEKSLVILKDMNKKE